ncbi:MAG TPA: hypothetical protein VHP58_04655 [Alphaproteobacteria bacterium]|nr:hypothetical protein [Alphaproteobacteria bacterium]
MLPSFRQLTALFFLLFPAAASAQPASPSEDIVAVYVGEAAMPGATDKMKISAVTMLNGNQVWTIAYTHPGGTFTTLAVGSRWLVNAWPMSAVNTLPKGRPDGSDLLCMPDGTGGQPTAVLANNLARDGHKQVAAFMDGQGNPAYEYYLFQKGAETLVARVNPTLGLACLAHLLAGWSPTLQKMP